MTISAITILDEAKAWDLLAGQQLGRLVVAADDRVDIFPVNYVVDGETIVFRTADGAKLAGLTRQTQVTFEIDWWNEQSGYSVVARGSAGVIDEPAAIRRAEALPLKPWIPTVKTHFVRITVDQISARSFRFGAEPAVDKA